MKKHIGGLHERPGRIFAFESTVMQGPVSTDGFNESIEVGTARPAGKYETDGGSREEDAPPPTASANRGQCQSQQTNKDEDALVFIFVDACFV